MLTWYCALCGDIGETETHHVVPRSMGGTDEMNNLLSVCSPCHARIHEFGVRRGDFRTLQRAGVERARAAGKFKGKSATATVGDAEKRVLELVRTGYSKQFAADKSGVSLASVYRICRKYPDCAPDPNKLSVDTAEKVQVLLDMGFTKQHAADQTGISMASVYRIGRKGATP